MIRKSGNRFSLATNAERVCAEIMLKQRASLVSVAKRISPFKIWVIARFSHTFFLRRTCASYHIVHMKHVDSESPSDVARWLRSESTSLWPALLGSLSLRRSRCIRRNCPACRSGEQHQSYVLYGRANGRRVAVYVPEELVPEVQRSLDNGRALQDLLQQAAPRYIKALKRERAEASRSKKSRAM